MSDSQDLLARSGSTHPLGSFDAKLPETACHSELVDELRVMAARLGLTASEFIRTTMEVRVYGLEHVVSLQAKRLQRIAGNIQG